MEFIKKLSDYNLWYLAIVVLAVMLLIGFWVGFWRGWKSALYFLGWNLVGYLTTFFVLDSLYDTEVKSLIKKYAGSIEEKIGADSVAQALGLFKGWVILVAVLVVLFVWNVLAYLIYLFFRKRLLFSIKENREVGLSNTGSRLFGGLIGTVTVLPAAFSGVAVTSVVSNDAKTNELIDILGSAVTFGKAPEISADMDAIYALLATTDKAQDLVNVLLDNLDSLSINDREERIRTVAANAENIKTILENPKSSALVSSIIRHIISKDSVALPTTDKLAGSVVAPGVLSGLSPDGKTSLTYIIIDVINADATLQRDWDNVSKFVEMLTGPNKLWGPKP